MRPDISVVIPTHNEKSRVAPTIKSIAGARTSGARVEFVVVDDGSTDGTVANLVSALPRLLEQPDIDIRLEGFDERCGNYHARNRGAEIASADILFMTDAHVEFSAGWDDLVLRRIRPNRILSGVTVQKETQFRSRGCSLAVPRMGTTWNQGPGNCTAAVQIAPCHATAITRELFETLNGYDTGMILYGGGEPEFSVRAWMRGAEIHVVPELEVQHQFKSRNEFATFIYAIRHYWIHNSLRFALLYLGEPGCLQVLQYYSQAYPEEFQEAVKLIDDSDVWERRSWLEENQIRSFEWFAGHFGIRDDDGSEIA